MYVINLLHCKRTTILSTSTTICWCTSTCSSLNKYKQWKSDLHQYFQTFDNPRVTLEDGYPKEFEDREESLGVALCSHFQEPRLCGTFFLLSLKVLYVSF